MLARQHQPRHHQHRHHPEQGGAAGRHQHRGQAGERPAQPHRGDGDDDDDNQKFTMKNKHVIYKLWW